MAAESFYQAVYELVRQVPHGKVVTYGQIAAMLGSPRQARAVGYALFQLRFGEANEVPWHRVINASGGISSRGDVLRAEEQRSRLEAEGIVFDAAGRLSLRVYRWEA